MAQTGRAVARQPATEFAHLRRILVKNQVVSKVAQKK